ncbi:myosin-3-like isoform X2 [Physella acuta]|uniref:myosin-3-like isoform X2 n=1 Tax=Physella acuta TaxID=109671 RepID=UPI0027DE3873|nr:myosin-3-like isoform X2 [Physella acuta]
MSVAKSPRSHTLWQRAVSIAHTHESGASNDRSGPGKMSKVSAFQSVAVKLFETKKLLEKEREIKSKTEELEGLRAKLAQEQDGKQELQKQLDDILLNQSDASKKLVRAQELCETLRAENKTKTEHIEKLERNMSHMEDRMRNLEIRASEVEKAELTLESTRRNLENCQQELKNKEREFERFQERYDDKCRELEDSNKKVKEMEKKLDDLKVQVRHELMKNDNIERGLETIPRLREEISEKEKKILTLEKSLEEKTALLNASRKSAREYKDQIRDTEAKEEKIISLTEELQMAKSEVTTLKKLMESKNVLIQQKCQALDRSKVTVDTLIKSAGSHDEKIKLGQIQQVLDRLVQIYLQTLAPENKPSLLDNPERKSVARREEISININEQPYRGERNSNKENHGHSPDQTSSKANYFLTDPVKGDQKLKQKQIRNNAARENGTKLQRSSSFHHPASQNGTKKKASFIGVSHDGRPWTCSPRSRKSFASSGESSTSGFIYTSENKHKLNSKYPPSLDYYLGVNVDEELNSEASHYTSTDQYPPSRLTANGGGRQGHSLSTTGSDTEYSSQDIAGYVDSSKLTKHELSRLSHLTQSQKDDILCDIIQIGDRVSIEVPQKPPRYGRKKPQPINYIGIVKYIGRLEKQQEDDSVYVGLRLDEPIGDSDGMYKGSRYIFTPTNYAKFFKIKDLNSVFDVSSGLYLPIPRLMLRHYDSPNTNSYSSFTSTNGHS